jgi:hypothetical protein
MKLKFLTVTTDGSGESCAKNYGDGTMLFDNETDRALDLQPDSTYIVPADLIPLPKGHRLLTDEERVKHPQILETAFYLDFGRMWRKKGPYTEHCWVSTETYAIPTDTVFPDTQKQEQTDRLTRRLVELSDALEELKAELGELKS